MNIEQLQNYENWIGKTPAFVLDSVIESGGWLKVFPDDGTAVPLWLSRVRNYFNIEPQELTGLDFWTCEVKVRELKVNRKPTSNAEQLALSRVVYKDENERDWFEMRPGGTVYHEESIYQQQQKYNKGVRSRRAKGLIIKGQDHERSLEEFAVSRAIRNTLVGQNDTPVFKLVAPDGTGGSNETCIHNHQLPTGRGGTVGKDRIGPVGRAATVATKRVIRGAFRGSYNYAETVVEGFDQHTRLDVAPHPHTIEKAEDFYVRVPRGTDLSSRVFPATDNHRSSGGVLSAMILSAGWL